MRLRFIAPILLSFLAAQHALTWFDQSTVSGYFLSNYGSKSAEQLIPYHSWRDPRMLMLAALFGACLAFAQHRYPRIRSFCMWRDGPLSTAAVLVGLLYGACYFLGMEARSLHDSHYTALFLLRFSTLLQLGFKILSVLVVWEAFKPDLSHREHTPSTPEPPRRLSMHLLLAVAAGVHLLFPLRHYVSNLVLPFMSDGNLPNWLSSYERTFAGSIIDLTVALLLARFFLISGQKQQLFTLSRHSLIAAIGFSAAVLFCFLTPIGFILNAIPYGGGGIPTGVRSLLAVTEAVGMFLLYRALLRGDA
jgi:hypothetical protein